jgi:hypothetical protein
VTTGGREWSRYYDAAGDDPRETLLDALRRFDEEPPPSERFAVDLGSTRATRCPSLHPQPSRRSGSESSTHCAWAAASAGTSSATATAGQTKQA